jgi:hypothetical protein
MSKAISDEEVDEAGNKFLAVKEEIAGNEDVC